MQRARAGAGAAAGRWDRLHAMCGDAGTGGAGDSEATAAHGGGGCGEDGDSDAPHPTLVCHSPLGRPVDPLQAG